MTKGLITACLVVGAATAATAQAATARTTNLSGDWIGTVGTVYFNFIHRFESSAAPERKVTNSPTFLIASPLTSYALVGASYATNSTLAPRFPNEHEYFVRLSPLRQTNGAPLDAGVEVAYNDAAAGTDAELEIGRRIGRLRVLASARALARLDDAGVEAAYGGGAVFRLGRYVAVAADAATLARRTGDARVAWGAGLQFELPQTPHTMSLQVTNVSVSTLQGISRGSRRARFGFEYTIPVTLRRYAAHRGMSAAADSGPRTPSSTAAGRVVQLHIKALAFGTEPTIDVGTTVEWVNDDPLAHSVAAADSSFRSPLIQPGGTWRYTFTKSGKFAFACEPHPFMHGRVTVR